MQTEVAVVGAGQAGLAAARAVRQAGASVAVLEARDRCGGRTHSEPLPDGGALDLGGEFLTTAQTRVRELATAAGLELAPVHAEGDALLLTDDGIDRAPASSSPAESEAIAALEELSAPVDVEAPWRHPRAEERDRASLGGWLEERVSDRLARRLLAILAEAYFAQPVAEVPLLHALFYFRANGGAAHLLGVEGSPSHQLRVVEGAQAIADWMAGALGATLRLGAPVVAIEHDDRSVRVHPASGDPVRARRAIIAVPPALAGRIRYEPPLPARRDYLTQRFLPGSGFKIQLLYREPFWRRGGLSGEVVWVEEGAIACDTSPPAATPGVLIIFPAIEWSWRAANWPPERRRAVVLGWVERAFGAADEPLSYRETMWAGEQWSRGEVAVPAFGTWTRFGKALRPPIGPLHWAGTETATEFAGQIEGAIRSGERAAAEAVTSLLEGVRV